MKALIRTVFAIFFAKLAVGTASAVVGIDFVTAGDLGNAADTTASNGAVGYRYAIGKYEVTLTQYPALLNAVAAVDRNSLHDPPMETVLNTAGMSRSAGPGGCTYAVVGEEMAHDEAILCSLRGTLAPDF